MFTVATYNIHKGHSMTQGSRIVQLKAGLAELAADIICLQEVQEIHADLLRTDRRQDGSGYERHHDKMPYSQMYQSSDPQEFHRGADRRENGCSRKVLLISFSNKNEIKRA